MPTFLEPAAALRLLRHEATVHAVPSREVRDLGDALLLRDPQDAEPFWNRLEAVRFPTAADAFDRRLAEIGILFASIGRRPHIWLLPPYDTPVDIHARLVAAGFEDAGAGHVMVAVDDAAARPTAAAPLPPGVEIERHRRVVGAAAQGVSTAIVDVLLAAFSVGPERRPGVVTETVASLADPRFTHYLVRLAGEPVAVARRATFDGLSYLSSIGTSPTARGRGLGRLVTATATVDGFADGSEFVHLGVFTDNRPAKALYLALGYTFVGEPGPDMVLIG